MRKLAPAFILTSIVALSSGAAFAFGDMNKTKKTTTADTASTQTAPKASDETTKPTDPAKANPAMPSSANSTAASGSVAATNGSLAKPDACKGLAPTDAAFKANKCAPEGGEGASGPSGSASGPASGGSSSSPGASK